jgi:hypothetical protein
MVVERWSSGQLAATPAVNSTVFGNGDPPSTTLTSGANGSVVSWALVDVAAQNPSTRAYLSSATEENNYYLSSDGTWYFAYQSAATAGSQTFGLSAPSSGLIWSMVGIEIQAASGGGATPVPRGALVRPSRAAIQASTW